MWHTHLLSYGVQPALNIRQILDRGRASNVREIRHGCNRRRNSLSINVTNNKAEIRIIPNRGHDR
ncbi:hypothetical protein BJI47_15025 [Rhodococcus sp. 1168]|nr:hypothetical protein BJI47_15025 [Rhodococcus sp. 1168]